MMLKYDLADLARGNRRKGTRVLLGTIHGSLAAEREYLAALRAMLRQLFKAVREDVLPTVEREMRQGLMGDARLVVDVDTGMFERIKQLGAALGRLTTDMVKNILGLEGQRHTEKFIQNAKRALGIDLRTVVREEDLEALLETALTRNAGLITGLADDTVRRVQTTITNALLNGDSAASLRKQLSADFQFSDKRAKVIARDQIAKARSDMNRLRSAQAGITHYIWRTSKDERVRPLHAKLDGKVYEYGKPTGAEQGRPPGQPILCRCTDEAIVEF